MEKSSKLRNPTSIQSQKKIVRNPVLTKPSSAEIKPRIQRLCTMSGIPAKNPIPHIPAHQTLPIPLDPPKTKVVYSQTSDTDRKGSWESILASQKNCAPKIPNNSVPPLLLSNSSPRSPMLNYNVSHRDPNIHDIMPHTINFHNFDPIRTLQFLTLELKSRIKTHLPDEMNLHRIVTEIQQTIKRLSTVSTSTAIIETTSMVGGDERRLIREDYHSFSGTDSVSGQFALSVNNRKKYKNQTVQTENIEPLSRPPRPSTTPPPRIAPILISRADNTDSRHSLKKLNESKKAAEASSDKLQQEVSKCYDELQNLRKREQKLESLLKSRDKQVNQLQKELKEIETLMRDQIKLLHKDKIYIDLKSGGDSGNRNDNLNNNYLKKQLNNISTSTSLTNLQNSARSQPQQIEHETPNYEYENFFPKPQMKTIDSSPPTLIPPRVSLSVEHYKVGKEKNRVYNESRNNNKGGFYHEDSGDNDDDIIRSKKKLATATLRRDETNNLKDINLNMDEIKAIFNDVKLPSPPRKFQQELPSFM